MQELRKMHNPLTLTPLIWNELGQISINNWKNLDEI